MTKSRILGLGFLFLAATLLWTHEGHDVLPSRGAEVDLEHGEVSVSAEAREALDMGTTEVIEEALPETVLASAQVVSPWQGHVIATSRLPGRIANLFARAGQEVKAGQVLAEMHSPELEGMFLELANAGQGVALAGMVLQGLKEAAGAFSGLEMIEGEFRLNKQQLALELAQARWLSLGLPLPGPDAKGPSLLLVRSPGRGRVIHADLSVGRLVTTGRRDDRVVEIREGLKEGETVAAGGAAHLQTGFAAVR